MNRERAREILPIIEAFANGEKIQFHDGDDWFGIGTEGIDAEALDDGGLQYRIKPKEPREFWVRSTVEVTDSVVRHPISHVEDGWIFVREVLK